MAVALQQGHDKVVAVLLENDTRGKVKLPALHIAAKKDDVKAATLLLQNEHSVDGQSKVCVRRTVCKPAWRNLLLFTNLVSIAFMIFLN